MTHQKIHDSIVRLGTFRTVVFLTLLAIFSSIAITWGLLTVMGRTPGWDSVIIAALVPFLIASPLAYIHTKMIIDLDRLESQYRRLATVDPLTGLNNRRAFRERAESLINLGKRHRLMISVAYIDVDRFKSINDSNGHQVGDRVLESFGHLLATGIRRSDVVGRVGGEEFAILLPNTDVLGARALAEKIRKSVENQTITTDIGSLRYTVSIGLAALSIEDIHSLDDILTRADAALYSAKQAGRNRVVAAEDGFVPPR